jgi:hypothetical protein
LTFFELLNKTTNHLIISVLPELCVLLYCTENQIIRVAVLHSFQKRKMSSRNTPLAKFHAYKENDE